MNTMNRRSFIRSLGGAVAAAMLPFARPVKLSAPKKAKIVPFWFQTHRLTSFYDDGYRAALKKVLKKAQHDLAASSPNG